MGRSRGICLLTLLFTAALGFSACAQNSNPFRQAPSTESPPFPPSQNLNQSNPFRAVIPRASTEAPPAGMENRSGPAGFDTVGVPSGAFCPVNLQTLDARLPHFASRVLENTRNAVVQQDLVRARDEAKAAGLRAEDAIALNIRQAQVFDQEAQRAAQCAASMSALQVGDEDLLRALYQPRFTGTQCVGMFEACVCQIVNLKMGALANRMVASAFRCYQQQGLW